MFLKVSIPYKRVINKALNEMMKEFEEVSIPYKRVINDFCFVEALEKKGGFNPL